MEPINLNGKMFCSNCGLTIGNSEPAVVGSKIFNFSDNVNEPTPDSNNLDDEGVSRDSSAIGSPITDQTKQELGITTDTINPTELGGDNTPVGSIDQDSGEQSVQNNFVDQTPAFAKVKVNTQDSERVTEAEPIVADLISDERENPNTSEQTTTVQPDNQGSEETATAAYQTLSGEPVLTDKETVEDTSSVYPSNNADVQQTEPTPEVPGEIETVALSATLEEKTDDITEKETVLLDNTSEPSEDVNEFASANIDEMPDNLIRTLDIPSEKDFEHESTLEKNQETLDSQIKQVDTLGASGILLDILSDEQSETNENIEALGAAKSLLKEIHFDDTDSEPQNVVSDIEVEKIPEVNKFNAGILEDAPQNPTEFLEIGSPLDELEILPPEEVGLPVVQSHTGSETVITGDKKNEETKTETINTPDGGVEVEPLVTPELIELEKEIKEAKTDKIDITENEAEKYDPDSIPSNVVVDHSSKEKILADYFKNKLQVKKNGANPKKVSGKNTKPHKLIRIFLIVILTVMTILILLTGIFYFINNNNPKIQYNDAVQKSPFKTEAPTYIIEGYTMSSTNLDEKNKTLSINYVFANNSQATIKYSQASPKDQTEYMDSLLEKDGTVFLLKTIDNTEYTEIGGNMLVWTKNSFVYTIEATNYDLSLELLYKMAKSVK